MNQIYKLKIYNGVNHNVTLFNPKDIIVDRKGNHFIKNKSCIPEEVIPQAKPLSIYSNLLNTKISNLNFLLPEAYGSQLDSLQNYYNYDIIIVSSRYANLAIQTHCGGNLDFLDRLFIPIPLYNSQNSTNLFNSFNKIGSCGLRKVSFPKTPQVYMEELHAGYSPSISSMGVCLSMYKDHNAYCDFNTSTWLNELEKYLSRLNIIE